MNRPAKNFIGMCELQYDTLFCRHMFTKFRLKGNSTLSFSSRGPYHANAMESSCIHAPLFCPLRLLIISTVWARARTYSYYYCFWSCLWLIVHSALPFADSITGWTPGEAPISRYLLPCTVSWRRSRRKLLCISNLAVSGCNLKKQSNATNAGSWFTTEMNAINKILIVHPLNNY